MKTLLCGLLVMPAITKVELEFVPTSLLTICSSASQMRVLQRPAATPAESLAQAFNPSPAPAQSAWQRPPAQQLQPSQQHAAPQPVQSPTTQRKAALQQQEQSHKAQPQRRQQHAQHQRQEEQSYEAAQQQPQQQPQPQAHEAVMHYAPQQVPAPAHPLVPPAPVMVQLPGGGYALMHPQALFPAPAPGAQQAQQGAPQVFYVPVAMAPSAAAPGAPADAQQAQPYAFVPQGHQPAAAAPQVPGSPQGGTAGEGPRRPLKVRAGFGAYRPPPVLTGVSTTGAKVGGRGSLSLWSVLQPGRCFLSAGAFGAMRTGALPSSFLLAHCGAV
jgi:hypothetical protein